MFLGLGFSLTATRRGEPEPTADHVFRLAATEGDDTLAATATNVAAANRTAALAVTESDDTLVSRTVAGTTEQSIFGFYAPAAPPAAFAGTMLTPAEQTGADFTAWSKQSNDPALTAPPFAASGAQTAARYWRFTDDEPVTANDRVAFLAKVDSVSGGNFSLASSNLGASNGLGSSTIARWRGVQFVSPVTAAAQLQLTYATSCAASVSVAKGINLTTLMARKQIVFVCVGDADLIGNPAIADPAFETPVEGVVAIPMLTNTTAGSTAGAAMLMLDPVPHQTGNTGAGPLAALTRPLRARIPDSYTPVMVAGCSAANGFKSGFPANFYSATGTARVNVMSQLAAVMSAAPAGSIVGGIFVSPGRGDTGTGPEADIIGADGIPGIVNAIRTLYGSTIPTVIMEMGGDPALAATISAIAAVRKLRTGSGDAAALSNCVYVSRPSGSTYDASFNYLQATHRTRGVDGAAAMLGLIYPALTISGTPVTTATVGTAYAGFTPSVTGGTTPYAFAIQSGTLPPGLSISSSTGAVSGTPTTAGTYAGIVIRATDATSPTANTTDLAAFTITVSAAGGSAFTSEFTSEFY